MGEILRLALLGGLLGLDGTSAGQFMLSRPLVAGALAGWAVGDVSTGILIGAVLELFLLVSFPTGGARFPEGSTATVVAVGTAVALTGGHAYPLAVALGLVWGQLGGATITGMRHLNAHLAPDPGQTTTTARIAAGHLAALGLDFARATAVTGVGLFVGRLALGPLASAWSLGAQASLALLTIGGVVSMGILVHDAGGVRARGGWLAAGLALGLLGARLL